MKRKEVDDVLGGDQAWQDADSTTSEGSLYCRSYCFCSNPMKLLVQNATTSVHTSISCKYGLLMSR